MRTPIALTCLALAACQMPPERPEAHDVSVPEAWRAEAAGGEVSEEPWWPNFEDPGLTAAVLEAFENNRDLRAAAARVEAARALAAIAGADRLPQVGAGLDARRNHQVFTGFPVGGGSGPLTSTASTYGFSIDIAWEVDLWGKLSARAGAAAADYRATALDYEAVWQALAAETARAWFRWKEAQLLLELGQRTVANFERNTQVVSDRYRRGTVPAVDLRLARSNLASAQGLADRAEQAVERSVRALEILLGRYPDGDLPSPAVLPSLPPSPPAGLPGELLRRRPDLLAASARLQAADLRLVEAEAQLYPSLVLTASGGRLSEQLEDLLDGDFDVWSIAAGLAQPIYAGGRLRAGVDLADARVQEALASWSGQLLLAFGEVEAVLAIERALAAEERHFQSAADEAVAARDLSESRYNSGLSDFLDVLTAQRRALENEAAVIEIQRRRLETRVDLYLALGGGFPPSSAPPAPFEESAQ